MERMEFAKISETLGGGNCGDEFWPEIEMVYMSSDIAKEELAYIYWNKTGTFERMVSAVREYIEAKEKVFGMSDMAVRALYTKDMLARAERLANAAREVIACEIIAKEHYGNRPKHMRKDEAKEDK